MEMSSSDESFSSDHSSEVSQGGRREPPEVRGILLDIVDTLHSRLFYAEYRLTQVEKQLREIPQLAQNYDQNVNYDGDREEMPRVERKRTRSGAENYDPTIDYEGEEDDEELVKRQKSGSTSGPKKTVCLYCEGLGLDLCECHLREENNFCDYCGKWNHKVENCRVKHGSCRRCGVTGHTISDCPEEVVETEDDQSEE